LLMEAGGGAGASFVGEEAGGGAGDEVLKEVAADISWVFSGADGTKGSGRSVSSESTPMLLALVSSNSRGEEKSSSTR
jgi:hypothetical protein